MLKYALLMSIFVISACADNTELSLSINMMKMDYREYDWGKLIDSEKTSALPGFGIQYKKQLNKRGLSNRSYFDIDYSQYYGNTDYVGFNLGSGGGHYGDVVTITKNTISDGSFGYSEEKLFNNYLVFMRLGIGYRYWERALSDGHTEEYTWPYGTVKMGMSGELTSVDTLGIAAEYHYAISPKMKSNSYGVFDLGRTDGFSVVVPWEHTLTSSWAIKFTYMYQTWNISQSNTNFGYYEPASESKFHSINAALVYCY
ncbi:hypothetical protein [Sulfuricurvum sp.]|uniref:hypothetical protein n=1 Tax=Sulfuricurvum sp. TaxID=2025608 RepID=UPI00262FEC2A|nr:hypothetical protein [Sulfuricurvum sp.]MDD2266732.1 hypothetical protein [Sulfuricurvum sp.]MDD2783900.1 hypothetical protein [Sulfuricurvum sp.]